MSDPAAFRAIANLGEAARGAADDAGLCDPHRDYTRLGVDAPPYEAGQSVVK